MVDGFVGPPFLLREICNNPENLETLKSMKFIHWGGAPLDQKTGDTLCEHVKMASAIGTTESGPYFLRMSEDPHDWSYYYFRDGRGMELDPRSDSLAELVFRKNPEATWQQVFLRYPDLQEYRTKDLFEKHPSKPGLWRFVGRTDDMIILANGENLHGSNLEAIIMRSSSVRVALVGGDGRNRPFLILQPGKPGDRDTVLEII